MNSLSSRNRSIPVLNATYFNLDFKNNWTNYLHDELGGPPAVAAPARGDEGSGERGGRSNLPGAGRRRV